MDVKSIEKDIEEVEKHAPVKNEFAILEHTMEEINRRLSVIEDKLQAILFNNDANSVRFIYSYGGTDEEEEE